MIIDWQNSASYISAPGTIVFTTSGAAVSVGVYIETVDGTLTLIGSVDLSTVMAEFGEVVLVLTLDTAESSVSTESPSKSFTLAGTISEHLHFVELGDFAFVLTPAIIDEIISGAKVYIETADGTVVLVLTGIDEYITAFPTTAPKTIRIKVLRRCPTGAKIRTRGVVY